MKSDTILLFFGIIVMIFFAIILIGAFVNDTFGEEITFKSKCIDDDNGVFEDEYCVYKAKCIKGIGNLISTKCDKYYKLQEKTE